MLYFQSKPTQLIMKKILGIILISLGVVFGNIGRNKLIKLGLSSEEVLIIAASFGLSMAILIAGFWLLQPNSFSKLNSRKEI